MLAGIETLAALLATQTFRMPVVAQRLFTFRCDGQTDTHTHKIEICNLMLLFKQMACTLEPCTQHTYAHACTYSPNVLVYVYVRKHLHMRLCVCERVCACGCLNYQSKRVCRTCGTSTFHWSVSRSGQRFLAKACTTLMTSEKFMQVTDWELNTEHKYLYGMHVEHKTKGKQMKKTQNHRPLRRQ